MALPTVCVPCLRLKNVRNLSTTHEARKGEMEAYLPDKAASHVRNLSTTHEARKGEMEAYLPDKAASHVRHLSTTHEARKGVRTDATLPLQARREKLRRQNEREQIRRDPHRRTIQDLQKEAKGILEADAKGRERLASVQEQLKEKHRQGDALKDSDAKLEIEAERSTKRVLDLESSIVVARREHNVASKALLAEKQKVVQAKVEKSSLLCPQVNCRVSDL